MPKPKRLLIRGISWKLVIGRPPGNKCDGICDYDTRTIYVRKTASDMYATVAHEILHAAFPDVEEDAILDTERAIIEGLETVGEFLSSQE